MTLSFNKKNPVILIILIIGVSFASSNLQSGDSFYSLRAENAHGNMVKDKNIKEAIKHYSLALKEPQAREEAAWKLLRAYYFLGCFATPNDKERYNVFEKARAEGKAFWKEFPKNLDVAYWYSVNLALWARSVNPLRALNAGSVSDTREIARMLIAQGHNKEAVARGHQILGRAHQVLPRMVVVLNWVNRDSVEHHYKKALSLNQNDIATRLFLADFYKDRKRNQEFEAILKPALQAKPRPEEYLEDERNLLKMKRLLSDPKFSEFKQHQTNLENAD
jgi:tetratricopeptide (TPR) repeat protein